MSGQLAWTVAMLAGVDPLEMRSYAGPLGVAFDQSVKRSIAEDSETPPALEGPPQGPLPLSTRANARLEAHRIARGEKKAKKRSPHRVLPLPAFKVDPAIGTMVGLKLRYVNREPGANRNRIQLDAEGKLSTKLVQQHNLELRMRDLAHRREIFTLGGDYIDDPGFPYAGVGNDQELRTTDIERLDRYQVHLFGSGAAFSYQEPIVVLEPETEHEAFVLWFVGTRFHVDRVVADPDSLYARDERRREWLRRSSVFGGVGWDSRSNEWNPKSGGLHDVSVELAAPWLGATSTWLRTNLSLRFYQQLGTPKVVFADEILVDGIVGRPPFLAMGDFGGLYPVEGLGGAHAGRGFYRRRFIGKTKAFNSAEFRFELFTFHVFRFPVTPGLKLFMDVGKVFEPDDRLIDNIHVSGGPGAYFVLGDFFVFRVDVGLSEEGNAVYVISNHAF